MLKPTTNDYIQAIETLNTLNNLGFFQSLKECSFYHWKHQNYKKIKGITFANGSTKICIFPAGSKWVIKLPLEYFETYEGQLTNYCERECDNYRHACDNHLDEFFASTYYAGTMEYKYKDQMKSIQYYLQEIVDCDNETIQDIFADYCYQDHCEWHGEPNDDDDYDSYEDAEELDDENRICALLGATGASDRLIDFCDEFKINDLHSENWGIRNGNYVLVDYSGYALGK